MSIELPDWLRGTLLLGRDGAGNIIPILIDAAGQINVLLRGVDALGNVRTVRVDPLGQLYAILRGAGGNDVAVDPAGNLASILKGIDGFGTLRTLLVDAAGQAIMVPRGASGNYMDVNAAGYLTAVLKGMGITGLTTIAVDANGRIEAFVLDGEDQWGQTLKTGMAELAGRLNPLRTYDWRGSNLYQCDFGRGIPAGFVTLGGAGAAVALDPTYWRTGGYALKLTGGSTLPHTAAWGLQVANPPSPRQGIQVEFSVAPGLLEFYVEIVFDYGANRRSFGIMVQMGTELLFYYDDAGDWTNFHAIHFFSGAGIFYRMKLVVDGSTGHYVRALFNNEEVDMTALECLSAAAAGLSSTVITFTSHSRATFNDVAYLDSFVVTVNEP